MDNRKLDKEIIDKILLRVVKSDDVEFLYSISNNEELMKIFCDDKSSLEEWINYFHMWQQDDDEEVYIIIRKSDNKYLGWTGINGLLSEEKIVWIKMIALLPEFWGKGYGYTTINKLKDIINENGFNKVRLWTDKCNKRSQECYFNNGFKIIDEQESLVGTLNIPRERLLMEYTYRENR